MKGIDNYFACLELQHIIPFHIKALALSSHRQLLHMFGTTHHTNILQCLLKFQATFRRLVGLWLPQTDRRTQTYRSIIITGSYYKAKYIFTVELVFVSLLGVDVGNIIKFKS